VPVWLSPLRIRALLALACLAGAAFLLGPLHQERELHRADQALAAGRTADAIALTGGLDRRSVQDRAQRVRSIGALQLGDVVTAERELRRAVRAAPNDWSLRLDRAVLLRRLGRRAAARREYERALALNPRLTPPVGFVRRQTPAR
jgi:Flp pilus assembly protein TadD